MAILAFQKPEKVIMLESTSSFGRFEFRPLEPGFGMTVGNALRRILLSSLEGYAITTVKVSGVDHEFAAIPGVMEGMLEIILNLKQVRFIKTVENVDSEKVTVQKTPTVLEELVDTVLVRFQKLHPGVPVEVKLPDDFIVIPMDSMLIQQVLTNLLENAVLHAEGMTHLTLRVFTLGRRAVFEVIDNGCGIPKEQLKRLFSGTTLAQDTSSSGKHGMGIGLSVCAAIIKAHGGEIKAESTPGEGTTIRFWLETEEVDTEETEDEQ